MNKLEFLNGLRQALVLKMDENKIQEQIKYYEDYIESEVHQGRTEAEVVAELGDPWILAKNLATNSVEESVYIQHETLNEYGDVESEHRTEGRNAKGKSFVWKSNSTLGCWIFAIIFILIVFGILYLLVGAVSVLAPYLVPIIIVMIIVRFIQKRMK